MPLAASAAAGGLDATTVRLTGMPYADKMALDSISVRTFSRRLRHSSMKVRACLVLTWISCGRLGGVSCRSSRLREYEYMCMKVSTASSGVAKVGMRASLSILMPASTSRAPIHTAMKGLDRFLISVARAWATPVGSVMA